MMERLFRGKRIDTDEWIVGYYVNVVDFESGEECPVIIPWDADLYSYGEIYEFHFVDPYTVGQFIGKCDAYGRKIFEGDVMDEVARQRQNRPALNLIVRDIRSVDHLYSFTKNYVVIGNIHDNPELLDRKDIKNVH